MKIALIMIVAQLVYIPFCASGRTDTSSVNGNHFTENKKLRLNGVYIDYDTSRGINHNEGEYSVNTEFLAFLENGEIFYSGESGCGIYPSFGSSFEARAFKLMGTYYVSNDTLYARISTHFWGNGYSGLFRDAFYTGYIENDSEISGWQMVPPYPKVKMRFNENLKDETTPRTLHFQKSSFAEDLTAYLENARKKKKK